MDGTPSVRPSPTRRGRRGDLQVWGAPRVGRGRSHRVAGRGCLDCQVGSDGGGRGREGRPDEDGGDADHGGRMSGPGRGDAAGHDHPAAVAATVVGGSRAGMGRNVGVTSRHRDRATPHVTVQTGHVGPQEGNKGDKGYRAAHGSKWAKGRSRVNLHPEILGSEEATHHQPADSRRWPPSNGARPKLSTSQLTPAVTAKPDRNRWPASVISR